MKEHLTYSYIVLISTNNSTFALASLTIHCYNEVR